MEVRNEPWALRRVPQMFLICDYGWFKPPHSSASVKGSQHWDAGVLFIQYDV